MRVLALFLAFLLVLTSLPATAAPAEEVAPVGASEAPSAEAAVIEPAPAQDSPTLSEMLARSPRPDYAAGDMPSSVILAPGQEATPEAAPPEKKSHKTLWIVLGCVAGAALIWAIADSGGDGNGDGGGGGY